MSLYPAGYYARGITVAPSVTLPAGWQFGSALETASHFGRHRPVQAGQPRDPGRFPDLRRPLLQARRPRPGRRRAGAPGRRRRRRRVPGGQARTAARAPRAGARRPTSCSARTTTTTTTSCSRCPSSLGGIGLEHHQSSENGVGPTTSPTGSNGDRPRPAGRTSTPIRGTASSAAGRPVDAQLQHADARQLLWVYEGQTQYWGYVLAARSGLWSKQQARDALASTAAKLRHATARLRLAHAAGHHQRPDRRAPPRAALAQLAAQRGATTRGAS